MNIGKRIFDLRSKANLTQEQLAEKLNEFNEKHDYSIIETDQREGIGDLIDHVIQQSGHSVTEDITEEWREW